MARFHDAVVPATEFVLGYVLHVRGRSFRCYQEVSLRLVRRTRGPQEQQQYEAARLQMESIACNIAQDYWHAADMLGKLGRRLGAPEGDLGKDPLSCGLHCCGPCLVFAEWTGLRRVGALMLDKPLLVHSQFEKIGARTWRRQETFRGCPVVTGQEPTRFA